MQGTVKNIYRGGAVQSPRHMFGHTNDFVGKRDAPITYGDVERVRRDEVAGQIHCDPVGARGDRGRDERMAELGRNQAFELADQLMETFGQQIELELFDGNETILLSVVRAKNGTQRASTDLMKYSERPKRVWWRGAGSVCMQWNSSSWKAADRNTNIRGYEYSSTHAAPSTQHH